MFTYLHMITIYMITDIDSYSYANERHDDNIIVLPTVYRIHALTYM